jgi:GTP cyclohydrolase I
VREVFQGRYTPRPVLTDFPNSKQLDELYTVGPIAVRSCCAHHLVPILGEAYVGVIPGSRVVGLSKFARLAEWVLSRPQIQEEAAVQLADALEQAIEPKGLGVIIEASHLCTSWRGVRDQGQRMTTSVMRGLFRADAAARAELLACVARQGRGRP